MKVFMYMAALLCEACGLAKSAELDAAGLRPAGMDPDNEHTWDSDAYPKGPYEHGGGEADCPQHCDHCSLFLENPLTTEGVEYVYGVLEKFISDEDESIDGALVADRLEDEAESMSLNLPLDGIDAPAHAHSCRIRATWARFYSDDLAARTVPINCQERI